MQILNLIFVFSIGQVRKGFMAALDKMYAMEEASRIRDELQVWKNNAISRKKRKMGVQKLQKKV